MFVSECLLANSSVYYNSLFTFQLYISMRYLLISLVTTTVSDCLLVTLLLVCHCGNTFSHFICISPRVTCWSPWWQPCTVCVRLFTGSIAIVVSLWATDFVHISAVLLHGPPVDHPDDSHCGFPHVWGAVHWTGETAVEERLSIQTAGEATPVLRQ